MTVAVSWTCFWQNLIMDKVLKQLYLWKVRGFCHFSQRNRGACRRIGSGAEMSAAAPRTLPTTPKSQLSQNANIRKVAVVMAGYSAQFLGFDQVICARAVKFTNKFALFPVNKLHDSHQPLTQVSVALIRLVPVWMTHSHSQSQLQSWSLFVFSLYSHSFLSCVIPMCSGCTCSSKLETTERLLNRPCHLQFTVADAGGLLIKVHATKPKLWAALQGVTMVWECWIGDEVAVPWWFSLQQALSQFLDHFIGVVWVRELQLCQHN